MLNRHLVKRGIKVNSKFYNPEKHAYMNRHHDDYADSTYWPGRILQPKKLAQREANQVYLEKTALNLFEYLREAQPKDFGFGFGDYDKIKNNSFYCYNIKLDEHIVPILDHLNNTMTIKEHRFRPAIEKQLRNECILYSSDVFDSDLNMTIDQFVQMYSQYVEDLVLLSNNGQRINKVLDSSDLEAEYNRGGNNGIDITGENDTLINRIMKYLH